MTQYVTRILSMAVLPDGEDMYSELATTISIDDEGAGAFLRVKQCQNAGEAQEIAINPGEWLELRAAIDVMIVEVGKFGGAV